MKSLAATTLPFAFCLCLLLLGLAACSRQSAKSTESTATPAASELDPKSSDACALLTPELLERILGEKPTKVERTETTGSGMTVSQCLFNMPTYSNSVSVQITRRAPGPKGVDPRAFLEKKIEEREKSEEGQKEGERPLDFVPDIGDKAIWMGTAVGGTLYVLKEHSYLRIALGSSKEPAKRREKAIAIAKIVTNGL